MTADGRRFHRKAERAAIIAAMALAPLLAAVTSAHAVRIGNSQLEPLDWAKIDGWAEDDHFAGFAAFLQSCRAILRGATTRGSRAVLRGLNEACTVAVAVNPKDGKEAREFFEQNFRPVRITPAGETAGFLTGYYEPVVEGSREPTEEYAHPLYRTPPGLLRGGKRLKTASFKRGRSSAGSTAAANVAKGAKLTKESPAAAAKKAVAVVRGAKAGKTAKARRGGGGRKFVSFYDRAAIDDGVLKGRNLEIAYLKDPVDSFFIQIQGSARVKLPDGQLMRVNYDSQNGHKYFAVGKWLVDQKIYTKEEMTMDRIRAWMTANPEGGKTLRRMNKSYVFFRETGLADNIEPTGAQGVSLTPGRSIAVDRNLHVYGTPFFIQAELPIDSEEPTTRWRRLMVAQDTGGAIVGPARADIYYGAGEPAGLISGRFKQPGQFVMLFPKSVDPFASKRGADDDDDVPLPRPRPGGIPQDEEVPPPAHGAPGDEVKSEPTRPELVAASRADVPLPPARPEAKRSDPTKTANVKPADKPAEAKPAETKPAAKRPAKAEPKKSPKAIEPAPPG